MLLASFQQMVAKLLLNSFDSTVGFVVDTPFPFRDLTDSFPDFLEVSSLIVCQAFLELTLYLLKLL